MSGKQTRPARLKLPKKLDITNAAQLAGRFLAKRGSDIVVEAGQLRKVGAQPLQVLLSAAATWQADNKNFRVVKPTHEFVETARDLGIALADLSIEDADQ